MPSPKSMLSPGTSAAARARVRWARPARPAQTDRSWDSCLDGQLVSLMQERNAHAFELFYGRHAAVVLGLAVRMVGDRGLAEDVTQEAFVSLWRGCDLYNPERGSARTWVLGIARHRAIDALRRRSARVRLDRADEGVAERLPARESTEIEVERRDAACGARTAVETLPGDQRRVIELAYFAGLSQTEIAAAIDVPLGTVKGRMRLALEKLRRALGPDEVVA